MLSRAFKIVIVCLVASALFLPELSAFADTSASSPSDERAALEQQLQQLEQQISDLNNQINSTSQQKQTLQNKIAVLQDTIDKLNLQIKQSNVTINDLGLQIQDTQNSIASTTVGINDAKARLSDILRAINEEDQRPLLVVLMSEGFSSFFENLAALDSLNVDNQKVLENIKSLKQYLENQEQNLDNERDGVEKQVAIQTLQKQQSAATQAEQSSLLNLTEAQYQSYVQQKTATEQEAQQIRSRIFELIGVQQAPTFGQAVQIADQVQSMTGVSAPFLLAVLYQESNIGQNVGQCYLKNTSTGAGVRTDGTSIANVMKPSRDVQPFLEITKELGRDWQNTPVSCPIPSIGGYGGAMGPAQFIPSTWMLFKDKVAKIKGSPVDPWNISDAFLAAAVYLSESGATNQSYDSEWCAALSYFAGSCSLSNQSNYGFYGDSVMYWEQKFESDIQTLNSQPQQ